LSGMSDTEPNVITDVIKRNLARENV